MDFYIKQEGDDVYFRQIKAMSFATCLFMGKNGSVERREMIPAESQTALLDNLLKSGYKNISGLYCSENSNNELLNVLKKHSSIKDCDVNFPLPLLTTIKDIVKGWKEDDNNSKIINKVNTLMLNWSMDYEPVREKKQLDELLKKLECMATDEIKIEVPAPEEIKNVTSVLNLEKTNKKIKIWKIAVKQQEKNFTKYCKVNRIAADDTKMLLHGSNIQNWYSILCRGLSLRNFAYRTNGELYGKGLYFSRDINTAMAYSNNHGNSDASYIGVFEVAYGKPLKTSCVTHGDYEMAVCNGGYDCLTTGTEENSWTILYDSDGTVIRYLVEIPLT